MVYIKDSRELCHDLTDIGMKHYMDMLIEWFDNTQLMAECQPMKTIYGYLSKEQFNGNKEHARQ